ncbi:hypothetical protein AB0J52_39765, partial [Spirillospora sp. NPDC049652]
SRAGTALHLRAAELLHHDGAPAEAVADRLVAADRAAATWAVAVLREAAGQALAEGRAPDAVDRLRLALRECTADRRPLVRFELARAEWQIDPATAGRYLSDLARDARAGRLPADAVVTLVTWMLWLGRAEEVTDVMVEASRATGAVAAEPGGVAERLRVPESWVRYAYPGLAGGTTPAGPAGTDPAPDALSDSTPGAVSGPASGAVSGSAWSGRDGDDGRGGLTGSWPGPGADAGWGTRERIVAAVEETLRHAGLGFGHLTRIAVIVALIHAGEPDEAERWCDALDREEGRRPPLADALVLVLRALIHHRRGEPDAARRCASGAFDLLPARGFGIFVGVPLAIMVEALTVTGRLTEAGALLRRPLPEALFGSPLVLPYLRARGRYQLASGRPRSALTEFLACRDLMASWGVDLPCVAPWRTDLAEAHLALGDPDTAHRLAVEQLALLSPGETGGRGATLRVLALALPHDRRLWPLAEAVELLERSPDRVELARALADLADHHRTAGRRASAAALARRARALADECGV